MKKFRKPAGIVAGLLLSLAIFTLAQASHHGWVIVEVFSNADGTLQFVEMELSADAHDNLRNFKLVAGDTGTGIDQVFTIPSSITGSLSGDRILFATAEFQAVYGILPDYIIPDGFLSTGSGDISYAGVTRVSWDSLPTDGLRSNAGNAGTPSNFSGVTVTLTDRSPPVLANLPGSALNISSNSDIPFTDSRVMAFLGQINCTDALDDNPILTNNVPDQLPAGETTIILINCTDSEGNTSTGSAQISVLTFTDTDNDGIADTTDPDDDGDGVDDEADAFPLDATESQDTDGDGDGNNSDPDDDGDGTFDNADAFPLDPLESADSDADGIGNNADPDDDNDGVEDDLDVFPTDPLESLDSDGDGTGNNTDADDDNDGVLDSSDAFPFDPSESVDSDQDGTGNNSDPDDDGDGVNDTEDAFPLDPARSEPEVVVLDADQDGIDDETDNCIALANADQLDTDNDGRGNLCDNDDDGDGTPDAQDALPLNADESIDTDGDGIGNNADGDDDGDGLPDQVEVANGLDPLSAADAGEDLDQDGRNNLEEFRQGTDLANDDIAPTFTIDGPLVIAATGRLTSIDFSAVTATDARDGTVPATVNPTGPFISGNHTLAWTAMDAAGNVAQQNQLLKVLPIVTIAPGARTGEGSIVNIALALSGDAPDYPVSLNYSISGDADSNDLNMPAGVASIESGRSGFITIETLADEQAEGDESVLVTLTEVTGAVLGGEVISELILTEENLIPTGSINVRQGENKGVQLYQQSGTATVTAIATDANPTDVLTYDWSTSDTALNLAILDQPETSFDVSLVPEGRYNLTVQISDSAAVPGMLELSRTIRVAAAAPVLAANEDTDGDGLSDLVEGISDTDGDGIEDFRDADPDTTRLPAAAGNDALMQTAPGLRLGLGEVAQSAAMGAALVSEDDMTRVFDTDGTDRAFDYPLGIFDFTIDQLANAGQTARITLPLENAIPEGAVYRKYSPSAGWQDLVVNATDGIATAPGTSDNCPAAGDAAYQDGLIAGNFCIQLTLSDGGINDADGIANAMILDPGGVAVIIPDTEAPVLMLPDDLEITSNDTINLDDSRVVELLDAVTCSDTISGNLPVGNDATDGFTSGTVTTVNFTCADAASNSASARLTVTITPVAATGGGAVVSDQGAGCFIATAAYGTDLAPDVQRLRAFRDDVLLTNAPGRVFVATYYRLSPPLAGLITRHDWLAATTRVLLQPLVWSVKYPVELTVLMLLSLSLMLLAGRRKLIFLFRFKP